MSQFVMQESILKDENPLLTVSVIIPTKNEGDTLEVCLQSVSRQSISPLEVIVVDGGSVDNTLNIAERFDAKIFKEEGISSPANARNIGAEKAEGEILLIMDADTVLHKDCVKHALESFNDKSVIAVLPTELSHDHSYLELIHRKWSEGSKTFMNIGLRKAKTSGLVAFYRREVFQKIKFNAAYGFGEDDDFSTRLESEFQGREILISEDCRVVSHSPHTIRELATRYMWWGRTSPAYFVDHLSWKSVLNMGSLLLPMLVTLTFLTSLVLSRTMLIFILLLTLFVLRISIACFRSGSLLFFQFVFFDFARSFFFVVGLTQSLFTEEKGR